MLIFLLALCSKGYACSHPTQRVLSDESLKNASPAIPFGLRAACADAKPARDSHWLLTSFGSAIPSGKLQWLRCQRADLERQEAL